MKDLSKVTNEHGVITALAIDQRSSLKKMLGEVASDAAMENFKVIISKNLTPYASAILLDPQYGFPAANERDSSCAALLSYEVSGYDKNAVGRLPRLLNEWSVARLKREGADAVKLLVYYDPDESDEINLEKKMFIERVGSECVGEDVLFFLEIITYDAGIDDATSIEYAKVRPDKVTRSMKEFSKSIYNVDVLKVEVPVNMKYVEGFGDDVLHTQAEAKAFFKAQNEATDIPFIFLSGGVSTELFKETLRFASLAGSNFNGILGGRAIWKASIDTYVEYGEDKTTEWMRTKGVENIQDIMSIVNETARPIR